MCGRRDIRLETCACFSSGGQCQLELKEVPSVLHALNVRDAKTADRLPLTVGVAAGASTQQYTYGASMVDSRQKVGDCFEYCWISASKQYCMSSFYRAEQLWFQHLTSI